MLSNANSAYELGDNDELEQLYFQAPHIFNRHEKRFLSSGNLILILKCLDHLS